MATINTFWLLSDADFHKTIANSVRDKSIDNNKALQEQIRAYRAKGYTVNDIVRATKLSRRTITRYISGK